MAITLTLTKAPEGASSAVVDLKTVDEALEYLKKDQVAAMRISGILFTDENIEKLGRVLPDCKALTSVDASNYYDASKTVSGFYLALMHLPNLHELKVQNTRAQTSALSEILQLMAAHPRLSKVSMRYNILMLPGTQVVAPMLAHNGGLRDLDISFNAMGAPGVDLLAQALTTNKGLVKINVDTSYDIKPSIPNVERMLEVNKNLIACEGLTSDLIAERLEHNRAEADKLADALLADPANLNRAQRHAINERMAAVTYLLQEEKGLSYEEVFKKLTEMASTGPRFHVDSFPAMMSILPLREVLSLSASLGKPLDAKDFFDPEKGKTPLMDAVIERGVGHQLFTKSMKWQSSDHVTGAYRALPESQRQLVKNLHELREQVNAETRKNDYTRRMAG